MFPVTQITQFTDLIVLISLPSVCVCVFVCVFCLFVCFLASVYFGLISKYLIPKPLPTCEAGLAHGWWVAA